MYDYDYQCWVNDGCDVEIAARVIHLSLSATNGGVNNTDLLKLFINLRRLDLSRCGLTTIPEEVWELTQLEYLYVNNNDICEISPKIKNLTNLKVFDCQKNNLTTFPVEICQLTKLSYFNFDNKLDILDSDVFDFITQIKYINWFNSNI